MKNECESEDKATYFMLKGKALNVTDKFDSQAFELLSKAIKFNPHLNQAWIQLGECYWKKNDPQAALNCFEGALKHNKNDKIALRNLSMVLRQLDGTLEQKRENLLKSLEKAKEAIRCDVEDGISWCILGNAYMTLFFSSSNLDGSVLKACKAAYNKAKVDQIASTQSDFLYNYANILHYEENYQDALDLLKKASIISPDWNEPSLRMKSISCYLNDVYDMINKQSSLKPKKIQKFIDSLKSELKKYSDNFSKLNNLSIGENPQTNIICKVIGCINVEKALAHTFCAIDSERQCVAIVVYNLAIEKGFKLGDTIVITNPFLKRIQIQFDNVKVDYLSIRVDNPLTLTINGKMLMRDYIARPKIDNLLKNN